MIVKMIEKYDNFISFHPVLMKIKSHLRLTSQKPKQKTPSLRTFKV